MTPLSERTLLKLREESEAVGGRVYGDHSDALEEDVTHFEEDDDPLTQAGDFEEGEIDVSRKG
jgi:hypothetical protein